jgi:hypothetical protein
LMICGIPEGEFAETGRLSLRADPAHWQRTITASTIPEWQETKRIMSEENPFRSLRRGNPLLISMRASPGKKNQETQTNWHAGCFIWLSRHKAVRLTGPWVNGFPRGIVGRTAAFFEDCGNRKSAKAENGFWQMGHSLSSGKDPRMSRMAGGVTRRPCRFTNPLTPAANPSMPAPPA